MSLLTRNLAKENLPASRGSVFSQGLESGALNAGAGLTALAGTGAETMGLDGISHSLYDTSRGLRERGVAAAPEIQSVSQVNGLDSGLRYAAGLAGQALPALGAGLVGAAVSRNPLVGASLATAPFTIGDVALRQQEDPTIAAMPAGQRLGEAVAAGGMNAVASNIVPVALGGKMLGRGVSQVGMGLGRNIATNVGEGVVGNAAAGVLGEHLTQQSLTNLNPERDTSGDQQALIDAGAGGAVIGAPFAAAGIAGQAMHGKTPAPRTDGVQLSPRTPTDGAPTPTDGAPTPTGPDAAPPAPKPSLMERMKGAFKKDETATEMDAAERIAKNEDVIDRDALRRASPEQQGEMLRTADNSRVDQVMDWAKKMTDDVNLSPETRAVVDDFMANPADRTQQAAVAAAKMAGDAGAAAMKKATEFGESMTKKYADATKGKALADVDSPKLHAAIADAIAPSLAERFPALVQNESGMKVVTGALRKVMAVMENTGKLDGDAVEQLHGWFGDDTPSVMASLHSAALDGKNVPATEKYFGAINKMTDEMSGARALETQIKSALPEAMQKDATPAALKQMVKYMREHFDGDDMKGKPKAQVDFETGQIEAGLRQQFGDKTDGVLKAFQKDAERRAKTLKEDVVDDRLGGNKDVDGMEVQKTNAEYFGAGRDKSNPQFVLNEQIHRNTYGNEDSQAARIRREVLDANPDKDVTYVSARDYAQEHGIGTDELMRMTKGKPDDYSMVKAEDANTDTMAAKKSELKRVQLDSRYHDSPTRIDAEDGQKFDGVKLMKMFADKERLPFTDEDGVNPMHRLRRQMLAGISALSDNMRDPLHVPDETVVAYRNGKEVTWGEVQEKGRTSTNKKEDANARLLDQREQFEIERRKATDDDTKTLLGSLIKDIDDRMSNRAAQENDPGDQLIGGKEKTINDLRRESSKAEVDAEKFERQITGLEKKPNKTDGDKSSLEFMRSRAKQLRSRAEFLDGQIDERNVDATMAAFKNTDEAGTGREGGGNTAARGALRELSARVARVEHLMGMVEKGNKDGALARVNKSIEDLTDVSKTMRESGSKEQSRKMFVELRKIKEAIESDKPGELRKIYDSLTERLDAEDKAVSDRVAKGNKTEEFGPSGATEVPLDRNIHHAAREYGDDLGGRFAASEKTDAANILAPQNFRPPKIDGSLPDAVISAIQTRINGIRDIKREGGKDNRVTGRIAQKAQEVFDRFGQMSRVDQAIMASIIKDQKISSISETVNTLYDKYAARAAKAEAGAKPVTDTKTKMAIQKLAAGIEMSSGDLMLKLDRFAQKSGREGDALIRAFAQQIGKPVEKLKGLGDLYAQTKESAPKKLNAFTERVLGEGDLGSITKQIKASDDAKALQRVVDSLAEHADNPRAEQVLRAANERITKMIEADPDVAYSMQRANPNQTNAPAALADVQAYVYDVLGATVDVEFNKMLHAGEFVRDPKRVGRAGNQTTTSTTSKSYAGRVPGYKKPGYAEAMDRNMGRLDSIDPALRARLDKYVNGDRAVTLVPELTNTAVIDILTHFEVTDAVLDADGKLSMSLRMVDGTTAELKGNRVSFKDADGNRTWHLADNINSAIDQRGLHDYKVHDFGDWKNEAAKTTTTASTIRGMGEDVIRVSVHAMDPMSTAYHESLHAFFRKLRDKRLMEDASPMMKAADSVFVKAKLRELLAGEPDAIKQIDSSLEERAAYMYQFWAAGKLELPTKPTTVLGHVADFFRKMIGVWSNDQRATHIMEYFRSGTYRADFADRNAVSRALMKGTNESIESFKKMAEPLTRLGDIVLSTGSARLRDTMIPALHELVDQVYAPLQGASDDPGYIPASRIKRGEVMNDLAAKLGDIDTAAVTDAMAAMQRGEKGSTPEERIAIRHVRKMLDGMHDYMTEAGVKVNDLGYGKDYFPRSWDANIILDKRAEFAEMLERYRTKGDFHGSVDEIISVLTRADGSELQVETMKPGMQNTKGRVLGFISALDAAPFVQKDAYRTLNSYVTQATRRAEWARRFKDDGSVLQDMLARAQDEGASLDDIQAAGEFLQSVDGTLGDKINPKLRRAFGNMIVYQNVRLLPLAIFSSLIDPMGIMVRGGTVGDSFKAFKRGITEIPKGFKKNATHDEWTKLAATMGVIDSAVLMKSLGTSFSQGMTGDTGRKVNDVFFKYNLMEQFNTSMRVGATEAAVNFMATHADGAGTHSTRWLAELGMKPNEIVVKNGRPLLSAAEFKANGMGDAAAEAMAARMTLAVNKWVDGAVLRPNAAHKPLWMSDPHFALISHLKQFVYSFQETILKRVVNEAKYGNIQPALALASYVPFMIAADMMKGMVVSGGGQPDYKEGWDAGDYVWSGLERAGVFGVGQFGLDVAKDVQRGGFGIGALAGPTVEQLGDAASVVGGVQQFKTFASNAIPANQLFDAAEEAINPRAE